MWGTRATGPLTIPAFLPPDWPTRGSSLLNLEPGPLPTQAAALTTGPSHGLLHGPASPGVGLSHPHLPSFRLSRPQQGTCSARTPPPRPLGFSSTAAGPAPFLGIHHSASTFLLHIKGSALHPLSPLLSLSGSRRPHTYYGFHH